MSNYRKSPEIDSKKIVEMLNEEVQCWAKWEKIVIEDWSPFA